MCHGVFDLVHPGHIRHLVYAKEKADILVASLTADAHITKAEYRPFVPQDLRALNLAALEMVDSFIGRMLGNIAAMSRVLDAETVVVGMRPAVAITLVELGMSLAGVRTALNIEKGMELLSRSIASGPADANGINGAPLG